MTRKSWMMLGALALLLAAGNAWGNEQNRKEQRHQLCKARHAARHGGHSRREAKARAWRQVAEARATVAASEWEGAFENLSSEVLVVAAELAQTGNHKAAMTLLQRVINSVPPGSDAAVTLQRVYDRGPGGLAWGDGEESDCYTQVCEESTCYQFDFGAAYGAWLACMQQASNPAANGMCGSAVVFKPVPCNVSCVPCTMSTAGSPITVCLPVGDCACGAACQCKKPIKQKPTAGLSAVRVLARLAFGVTGCAPGCMPMAACAGTCDAVPCSDDECTPRTEMYNTRVSHSENEEVQDVTVVRYSGDGTITHRHYQVQRTLSADGESSSRVERVSGCTGRFVHHISTDCANNCAQELYDFVPCDDE